MKAWRRKVSDDTSRGGGCSVQMNDVFQLALNVIVWDFTAAVAAISDPTAFKVNGQPPLDAGVIAGTQVTFTYAAAAIGDAYSINDAAAVTFDGGVTLCVPQNGVID